MAWPGSGRAMCRHRTRAMCRIRVGRALRAVRSLLDDQSIAQHKPRFSRPWATCLHLQGIASVWRAGRTSRGPWAPGRTDLTQRHEGLPVQEEVDPRSSAMIFFRFSGSCLFSSSRSPLPSPVPALRFLPGIRVLMSDLCGLRREMHARRRHAALPPARQRVERAPRPRGLHGQPFRGIRARKIEPQHKEWPRQMVAPRLTVPR